MSFTSAPPGGPVPRRVVSLPLVVLAVVLVAGASAGATAIYLELRGRSPSHGGVTVTDDLARTVQVPSNPARVVVLGPNILDTVFRLGLRDHVVGVDCSNASLGGLEGDYTPDQVSRWGLTPSLCILTYPEVRSADLLNVNPQLILASSIVSVSLLEGFSSTYGIPVVFFGPATLGSVVYDVEMAAEIFDHPAAAPPLVAQLQTALSRSTSFLTNLTNNGTTLRSVFMTFYPIAAGEPGAGYYSYGPGSFGQSLIELAGGVNIAGNASTSSPELSGSQVLYDDPSVVVYGTGFGIDAAQYAQGPDWGQFPAVRNGNATGVDVTLITEVDPTMLLEVSTLSHLLYPTLPGA
ncbi:MAG TPA: ABC transporter substrate-binding protein [Thermoplasmata archaeon]|nr:ABC transporter substrate-binding protein [Thermoplasmata archaeon]